MSDLIGPESIGELERIGRVSDQMTSAHAYLCDRYSRRSLILDLLILGMSVWLTAMVFVEPRIGIFFSPRGIDRDIVVGMIGIVSFFLSLVQIRVDWKSKADAHARASALYGSIKLGGNDLLSRKETVTEHEYRRFRDRYADAGAASVKISESIFNKVKKKHLMKVAISKHLSSHPATSILLLRLRLWWRDNLASLEKRS